MISLAQRISLKMYNKTTFTFKDVYEILPNEKKTTIRGRVYDNLGKLFEKIDKGIYRVIKDDNECLIIEGDGRDLSKIGNSTIDAIITDHPWLDKANKGGSRNFANTYNCFKYELKDFIEKFRVLKDGCFLVEIIPAENNTNYEYLYELKQMAKQAGFLYYSKVSWKKGNFVSNTGRKTRYSEDIMFFTKGKARSLRLDMKKTKKTGIRSYMSGTNAMLPAYFETLKEILLPDEFDISPVSKKEKIHQSEKPLNLIIEILKYITLEKEIVLDQFAGSGVVGEACLLSNRDCILIEKLKENVTKITNRLGIISDKIQVLE